LLKGKDRREMIKDLIPIISLPEISDMQKTVPQVQVADALVDYLQAILEYSRHSPRYRVGLSPRAGLAVLHSAQAWALMQGRNYVVPEDVQMVLPGVIGHRLAAMAEQQNTDTLVSQLIEEVAIP
jgi:MoxR-like ATPase